MNDPFQIPGFPDAPRLSEFEVNLSSYDEYRDLKKETERRSGMATWIVCLTYVGLVACASWAMGWEYIYGLLGLLVVWVLGDWIARNTYPDVYRRHQELDLALQAFERAFWEYCNCHCSSALDTLKHEHIYRRRAKGDAFLQALFAYIELLRALSGASSYMFEGRGVRYYLDSTHPASWRRQGWMPWFNFWDQHWAYALKRAADFAYLDGRDLDLADRTTHRDGRSRSDGASHSSLAPPSQSGPAGRARDTGGATTPPRHEGLGSGIPSENASRETTLESGGVPLPPIAPITGMPASSDLLSFFASAGVSHNEPGKEPRETGAGTGNREGRNRNPGQIDWAEREEVQRKIGRRGERYVLEHERQHLIRFGRADLAERVKYVSAELGDGAGYDVLSYFRDGREKYIEVKSTSGAGTEPFYLSLAERNFLEAHRDDSFVYRVSKVSTDSASRPELLILTASYVLTANLAPVRFRVRVGRKAI